MHSITMHTGANQSKLHECPHLSRPLFKDMGGACLKTMQCVV